MPVPPARSSTARNAVVGCKIYFGLTGGQEVRLVDGV